MEIDWENPFKAEDFNFDVQIEGHTCDPEPGHLSDKANARFRELLERAPIVYGGSDIDNGFGPEKYPHDTHSAKLIAIKELI